ncbi:hypothetical protein KVR01_006643 [Diaporthe batatas]|uniref:uncharacterized protein n=1 Tax=Diaporthe batatas TaxID=748121 RepID=UPI001D03A019|nr:uncharacterized protein KVR01_006643 [Diaporthe batatas]KAG8163346.1 hypothetical protein KVR01_006643 [Diaporthe batatas]
MKLTQDQVPAFEEGLPINKLRRTFQEALVVAHRMRIPYIWIDSLCIIQSGDDGMDWERECATMADVYSNSICNISADWGTEENGLFFQRDVCETWCGFEMRLKKGASEKRSYWQEWQSCYLLRGYKWIDDFLRSPLNHRGWVTQERLLAPRVLHFTPQQVSWECTRMLRSEKWPAQNFRSSSLRRLAREVDACWEERELMERLKLHDPGKSWNHNNLVDWWHDRVSHYTACSFTKESDKLVAIAGIAKKLQPLVKDQYVAGLWAKSLPRALAWRRLREFDRTTRIVDQKSVYCAPTFSWAAADGYVEVPSSAVARRFNSLVSTEFISYRERNSSTEAGEQPTMDDEILTKDVLGLPKSLEVEIRARGILRSCRLIAPEETENAWGQREISLSIDLQRGSICHRMDLDCDRAAEWEGVVNHCLYYYAPICWECSIDHFPTLIIERGLLMRSVDASMGRFERVGYVSTMDAGKDFQGIKQLGNEKYLPAWSYDEVMKEHTFYIV